MTATLDSSRLFSFAPSMKESAIPRMRSTIPNRSLERPFASGSPTAVDFWLCGQAPNGGVPKVSLPPSNGSLKNGKRKRKSFAKNFRTQKTQLDPLRRISVPDPQSGAILIQNSGSVKGPADYLRELRITGQIYFPNHNVRAKSPASKSVAGEVTMTRTSWLSPAVPDGCEVKGSGPTDCDAQYLVTVSNLGTDRRDAPVVEPGRLDM